ncbi:methyltransferase [Niallia sp. XMNu-256]|uniref:methyltransferase n=1 Tax=Niallia sp. XMNu-256 TaxID=3082444 RepID=UPI0030CC4761
MDKILVEVFVPVLEKTYDVFIPLTAKFYEIEGLLAKAITELTNGYFAASEDCLICSRESGVVLDINKSARELGLQNGSKLMLI